MIKKNVYLFILMSCIIGTNSSAKAQLQPGMIDMMPSINATINNSINSARTRILMNNSRASAAARAEAAKQKSIEERGAQIIKAGKATTRFTSSFAGTQAALKKIYFDPQFGAPQDLQGQIKYVQTHVKLFNQMMTKEGFTPYDVVDLDVMVYAIAYEAKYDSQPSIDKLKMIRRDSLKDIMSNLYYQGKPDTEKQAIYDMAATVAIGAYEYHIKARNATSKAEKLEAEKNAAHLADPLLNFFK